MADRWDTGEAAGGFRVWSRSSAEGRPKSCQGVEVAQLTFRASSPRFSQTLIRIRTPLQNPMDIAVLMDGRVRWG
jgi:hypothetical protein